MRNNLLSNNTMLHCYWLVILALVLSCTKSPTSDTPSQATPEQGAAALLGTQLASTASVDSLYKLIQQYNPLAAQLQIEKNRNQALVTLLQANQYASCLTKVIIKSVALNINGEALSALDITDQYDKTHSSLGDSEWNEATSNQAKGTNPSTGKPVGTVSPNIIISLGKSKKNGVSTLLTWTYDESTDPLFVISGEKTLSPTISTVTIGDIDTIMIQKVSVAYNYSESCSDGSTTCSHSKKDRSVAEDQRYHMMKLRLLINNVVLYDSTAEHFFYKFADPNNTAAAPNQTNLLFQTGITLNSAYLQALQRPNCDGL